MRVTIGIPTYNNAHILGDALHSALAQEYSNLEILVVDNASTDRTEELVSQYDRVRYVRNEHNLGMVGNFRRVAELAEGDLLCFLSSDDQLKPGFISWAVEALSQNAQAAFAFAGVEFFGGRSGRLVWDFPQFMPGREFVLASLNRGQNLTYICGTVTRTELVQQIGLPDDITFFDWTLWLRLAMRGEVVYTPQLFARYRSHDANETVLMMRRPSQHLRGLMLAVESFLQHEQPDPEIQQAAKRCFELLYRQYTGNLARSPYTWSEYWRDLGRCWREPAPGKIRLSLRSLAIRAYRQMIGSLRKS